MVGIFIDLKTAKRLAQLDRIKKKIEERKTAGGHKWKYVNKNTMD